ncbi:MAG: type II toxin-antitoxin system death-on-curing family toxin [Candidatus Pacebacteria bacterium]|nr:type II toxin-antitoxin system death-on-curing family toxin [Candidatus Paceibacterota bacterium]
MTDYSSLSIEKVLYLHDRIIQLAGGKEGIRDFTLLHSGLERCKATFAGEDHYPTLFDKASALLHSMVMNHPFLDANKRTAYQVMKRFLYTNGYLMQVDQDEIVRFCISVDNEGIKGKQIVAWLKKHTGHEQ